MCLDLELFVIAHAFLKKNLLTQCIKTGLCLLDYGKIILPLLFPCTVEFWLLQHIGDWLFCEALVWMGLTSQPAFCGAGRGGEKYDSELEYPLGHWEARTGYFVERESDMTGLSTEKERTKKQ